MKKATERRLAAAERMLLSKEGQPRVIVIHGGFFDSPGFADGGGRIWERARDEPLEVFKERVIADAKVAGLRLVVIGGLPPPGVELGTLDEFMARFENPDAPSEKVG